MSIPDPKPTTWKSKKWRDAAKGQPCTLRFYGCCNGNPETTVLAHRSGAGMALKSSDHDAVDACYECHRALDRPDLWPLSKHQMVEEFNRARLETIINRLERGILK